jgi:F420-non-reducing hydrogenase iron-sulfur subunit
VGDCHYLYGNYMTIKRVTFLQEFLALMGLEGRLHLAWISSAEAQKFVQVVTEFTDKIRAMGPNPISLMSERTGSDTKVGRAAAVQGGFHEGSGKKLAQTG